MFKSDPLEVAKIFPFTFLKDKSSSIWEIFYYKRLFWKACFIKENYSLGCINFSSLIIPKDYKLWMDI